MTLLPLILGVTSSVASVTALQANPATSSTTRPADGTRVMTFNIRLDTASDGENRWDIRKDFLIKTIRAADPDLLGTQEVLPQQGDYLVEKLPDYASVGSGRDDGKRKGEASLIFFRKSRYELVDSGQWWLSETPDKVGSVGWDAALPRIATWAVLKDRNDRKPVLFANTHFDHRGEKARAESAKLIHKLLGEILAQRPEVAGTIVLSGDFNCTEDSDGYKALVAAPVEPWLSDVYRTVHPQPTADEATFNGFKPKRDGKRIDWILSSPEWRAIGATIDRAEHNGRFPSDHYPVIVDLAR